MPSPDDLALIAAIADDLAAGIWVATAPAGRFVYANRAFASIMGMGPVAEAEAGDYAAPYGLFTRDGQPYPEHRMPFVQALEARETMVVDDIVVHRREGTKVYVRAHAKPLLGAGGEVTHVAVAFFDITREVAAEEARARADAERANGLLRELEARQQALAERHRADAKLLAADRLASLGTLAAGVAHEINGPLSYVIGNLDLGIERMERGHPSPEIGALLRDARQGAERVRAIVRDLKVFSHSEDEKARVVDVGPPLEAAIKMARNELRHRATLTTDLAATPPVWADESRLAQVFLNLLINAAQAIPEGAAESQRVSVSARSHREASGAEWVVIEFSDTGVGIPPDVLPRIFDPFFTTKPVGVGTGLGLAISHAIVTAFGGRIDVESLRDVGSTFKVWLPATARVQAAPAPPERKVVSRGEIRRILVVDDDLLILRVIRAILADDHDVTCESRASAALARIEAGERFDVILCDLMMPDMTGMDLHARIGKLAPDQVSAMIFLTGGAFTDRARDFIERMPNRVLEKPFDGPELLRRIGEVTG